MLPPFAFPHEDELQRLAALRAQAAKLNDLVCVLDLLSLLVLLPLLVQASPPR